jgi:dTDP-4-amino-4,6-dideoxygalactose transaminase
MSTTEPYIYFNWPHITGKEIVYIQEVMESHRMAGNGAFTRRCQALLEARFGFAKSLLTTSCTDALEMCALLADIQPGDEVVLPAYTFVSTANAFVLRGAKLVFADSQPNEPNMDVAQAVSLITPKTKAIVVMHYAGIATDMDPILKAAKAHNLLVIEDAAQAIDSQYKGHYLGTLGHLAAFSFHETKNISSCEGGLFVSNDVRFHARSEIIWEKGTNRTAFFRGEVDKYNWVDVGSSYLPSELTAAFLLAQLEHLDDIQTKRKHIWQRYKELLQPLEEGGKLHFPFVPDYATVNGHLFYLVCESLDERQALIEYLQARGIMTVFHYQRLHSSPFFVEQHDGRPLPYTDRFADQLLRLPLHYSLTEADQVRITDAIKAFYNA